MSIVLKYFILPIVLLILLIQCATNLKNNDFVFKNNNAWIKNQSQILLNKSIMKIVSRNPNYHIYMYKNFYCLKSLYFYNMDSTASATQQLAMRHHCNHQIDSYPIEISAKYLDYVTLINSDTISIPNLKKGNVNLISPLIPNLNGDTLTQYKFTIPTRGNYSKITKETQYMTVEKKYLYKVTSSKQLILIKESIEQIGGVHL